MMVEKIQNDKDRVMLSAKQANELRETFLRAIDTSRFLGPLRNRIQAEAARGGIMIGLSDFFHDIDAKPTTAEYRALLAVIESHGFVVRDTISKGKAIYWA